MSARVIDSHTGGEPTRVVVEGGPPVRTVDEFRERYDGFRRAVINEPRGHDVMVGALLIEPSHKDAAAGVIFFNNVGYLGMCGHGAIGVAVTLARLGRVGAGTHKLETPVGVVSFTYHGGGRVTVENVASYRSKRDITLTLDGGQVVTGDVAWGGNWFFISEDHGEPLTPGNIPRLNEITNRIRLALTPAHPEVDHVELSGPPASPSNHARNFVLCPGGAYDRSPCGTGTSAKVACLAAGGRLAEGEVWRQESVIGSVFAAAYRRDGGAVIPRITGSAFVHAEATLIFDPEDPFREGIPT